MVLVNEDMVIFGRPSFGAAPARRTAWEQRLVSINDVQAIEALLMVPDEPVLDRYEEALKVNGWDPKNPKQLPPGHYMCAEELFYYTIRVIQQGGVTKAGRDGDRFVELVLLLARNYMGKIVFRNPGHMANMAEDLVQEAASKCCLVVNRFNPWAVEGKKLNKAFAYFTTVIRNKMFETLESALSGSDLYLEDLRAENQSLGDVI